MLVWTVCGIFLLSSIYQTSAYAIISNEAQKVERLNPLASELGFNERKLCETEDCIFRAAELLKDMNKKVDPCDDFYEYTCGNFIKKTKIPDYKSSVSKFSLIDDQLTEQLRDTFENGIKDSDIKPFKMLKQYYNVCMNTSYIDKNSDNEVKAKLKSLGGWPVLEGDSWDESSFEWRETGFKFLKNGFSNNMFVSCDIDLDSKNTTKRIMSFDQAGLGISQKYLAKGFDDRIVKAYYKFMTDMAVILGADRARAESELMESLKFEMALANISLPMEKRRDSNLLYNPMKLSELRTNYTSIDWADYIQKTLMGYATIAEDEIISIAVPKYLNDVVELLNKTPARVQANYAFWRVLKSLTGAMSEDVRDKVIEFSKVFTGQTTKVPRWKKCVSEALGNFHLAGSSLYVRRFFDEDAKRNAVELIQNVRKSFKEILNEIDWMDDKTRAAALEKLEYIVPHVAFPDELIQDNKIEEYYERLNITSDSFVESKIDLSLFFIEKSFLKFRETVNKTDWRTHGKAAVVNAFYMPSQNSIMFPAGILQGVFFGKERPNYMNYGSIGWVMGHEITHGFDDQGRQFDKVGNLVEWWSEDIKQRYLERAQCIIDQYGNYTVKEADGMNLNGVNTQGENIADNGGIKEAYRAYNKWEKENGIEPSIPGFSNFTSQQMFWISAANVWCTAQRPEGLKSQITTGVHSPGRFRVIGPFSNMPEFARDFNCKVGVKMNPEKKCSVW